MLNVELDLASNASHPSLVIFIFFSRNYIYNQNLIIYGKREVLCIQVLKNTHINLEESKFESHQL